ncbi:MAG: hypothetical protein ACP5D2_02875, partial [Candidatus Nanoarchaeia archaeon]
YIFDDVGNVDLAVKLAFPEQGDELVFVLGTAGTRLRKLDDLYDFSNTIKLLARELNNVVNHYIPLNNLNLFFNL